MFAIKHLQIGDRVTIIYNKRTYSSVVQDMPEPDTVIIARPSRFGVYLNIDEDGKAEILFNQENGVLGFEAVQENRYIADGIPMLRLRAVSEVRRSQRRNYFRLQKSLPVQLTVKEAEPQREPLEIKAHTLDISGGGCRVTVSQPVGNGTELECRIALPPDTELALDGQVVWVEKDPGGDSTDIIGIQFLDEDSAKQRTLVAYVTGEQRRQLKTNRKGT